MTCITYAITRRSATAASTFGGTMANNVYNITEIVGTSPEGSDAAITNALAEAAKSLRNLDWFEVQSVRGHIKDGKVADWQVTIKVGFRHES